MAFVRLHPIQSAGAAGFLMMYGDEIQILVDGPSIRSKSLEPIGITHKSQCWGVWIEPRQRPGFDPPLDVGGLDFIISPIHPSLWPFAFRIEAALFKKHRTLKSLNEQLGVNGVNVLHCDMSTGGYTHSIFNAICAFDSDKEMFALLEELERTVSGLWHDRLGPNGSSRSDKEWDLKFNEERTRIFQKLGEQMIARLVGLWACLRVEEHDRYVSEDPNRTFFLAPRIVEQGLEPWFLSILDPDGIFIGIDKDRAEVTLDPGDVALLVEAQNKADGLMRSILDAKFPPADIAPNTPKKSINQLLSKLQETHRNTVYGPHVKAGKFTTQAKLAHMPADLWKRQIIRRLAWRHTHYPLRVQALILLAEMRFWMAPHDPIEFHYDAVRQLLVPTAPDFAQQVNKLARCGPLQIDKPVWALAMYDPEDRFVRLRFIPKETGRNHLRIKVDYEIPGPPAPDAHFSGPSFKPARSKGLVMEIAATIARHGGRIPRVTNSVSNYDPNTGDEKGNLHFVVEIDPGPWFEEDTPKFCREVEQAVYSVINKPDNGQTPAENTVRSGSLKEAGKRMGTPPLRADCKVVITPFKRDRIFVSHVHSPGRLNDILRILNEVASRYGLETVYARSNTSGVRQNVHRIIAECRYFLQIITPRADDQIRVRSDRDFVPDFTWVKYELGCANALQTTDPARRCVQMVDQLMPKSARRGFENIGGDTPPILFRLDDDDETLRIRLEFAIIALITEP